MADYSTTKQPDRSALPLGVDVSSPSGGALRLDILAMPLSAQLRAQTAALHQQTEALLGLPHAIQSLQEYQGCLCKFLGLYAPLEHSMARFREWDQHGLTLPSPSQTQCLTADLAVLGIDPASISEAPPVLRPDLPTFSHALGALYVLEGSTLGGRMILRELDERIGPQISGATRFFGGRGATVGATWLIFKTALDAFGDARPSLRAEVVSGAKSVFQAITLWFAPLAGTSE
jgi:heme oxygenase